MQELFDLGKGSLQILAKQQVFGDLIWQLLVNAVHFAELYLQ